MHGVLTTLFLLVPLLVQAQQPVIPKQEDLPSPRGAFLRSVVLPGWGHYYADNTDWRRGQIHLAAETAMILSYAGLRIRNGMLQTDLNTYAASRANVELNGRDREFVLAVGNYNDLNAYNDFMLRSRNWDNLIPDDAANRWSWNSVEDRARFQDMRQQLDRNRSQLPTIVTLMVLNRVVSGISAFMKARDMGEHLPEARFSYLNEFGMPGPTAHLMFEL